MNDKYKIITDNASYDDGTSYVEVTDENNNSTIRKIDSDNIYYTLLTENKMELIGLKKEEINKEINAALDRIEMLKCTAPLYPIIIGVVGGFLILVKIFKPEALIDTNWAGLAVPVAAGEIGVGSVAIVEHIYNKKEVKLLKEQLKALKKYEKEPIYLDKPFGLEHNFDEENFIIQNDINNIVKSIDRKSLKRNKIRES